MSSNNLPMSRARSVPEIRERMRHFQSEPGAACCAAFRPRAEDVIVATYPKSGTTWMQMIVHGLRTHGDMDFEEITQVVPWLEMAYDMDIDLDAPQRGRPRAFKTHLNGNDVMPGCRYIFVVRDPRDVLVSFHRFFEGWLFDPGRIDLDTFATEFFLSGSRSGDYWSHLLSWWQRETKFPTLMLGFEEMKADLVGAVALVADFLGITDEAARQVAVRCASLDAMRAHASKFDDHLLREKRDPHCGLPPGGRSDKVATGSVGGHRGRLSASVLAQLQATWQTQITPALGFSDYSQLLAALPAMREQQQKVRQSP